MFINYKQSRKIRFRRRTGHNKYAERLRRRKEKKKKRKNVRYENVGGPVTRLNFKPLLFFFIRLIKLIRF